MPSQYSRFPDGAAEALITADNIVLFGFDPEQPKPEHWLYLLENQLKAIGAPRVRKSPRATAMEALKWLEARCDYILVHFHIDVVSSEQVPLGNYPHYCGLSFEDAIECLEEFVRSDKLAGCVVTEVNAGNDPGGQMVKGLVFGIVEALQKRKLAFGV
jgi:arginase